MVSATTQGLGRGSVAQLLPGCSVASLLFDNIVGENVRLNAARLVNCTFREAILLGTDLTGAALERVRFVDCHLAGSRFDKTQLDRVTFTHCNLEGSTFRETSLDSVELDQVERKGWRCDDAVWHRFPGYELEKRLGDSGAARTYRAKRRGRVRPVALKIYRPSNGTTDAVRRRILEHEGPLAKRVQSRHVARVVDFGVLAKTAEPYVATEFMKGETLAEATRVGAWRWLSDDDRMRLFREMAAGLSAIHRTAAGRPIGLGVPLPVHGDVRPSNIYLARYCGKLVAKLIDFGAVRRADGYPQELTRTNAEQVAYDPPEVLADGRHGGPIADVYALGVTMLEAFGRGHPYLERLRERCRARPTGTLTRAEAVNLVTPIISRMNYDTVSPRRLQPILRRCTQVVHKLRYQDGTELLNALDSF